MKTHEIYMQRCLQLARNGLGNTYPNPLVGSVIVLDNKIIGESWHQKAGTNHAEVNAVLAVKDKSLLAKATIYVNLEPCSHFGKTPPCADWIVQHKIPNVVIGTTDPNPQVAGRGIQKLLEAGINVTVGVLETECNELNKRFFSFINKKRPYIFLKWATSANQMIAPKTKETQNPVWISNVYSRQLVHQYRTQEQAILVGTATVLQDNPSLDARDFFGNSPIRVVLDKNGSITEEYKVKNQQQKTIFITEKPSENTANCIYEKAVFDTHLAKNILNILYKHQIQSIIIEGGTKTLQLFIDANLWDEAIVFSSETYIEDGIKAPVLNGKFKKKMLKERDVLYCYSNSCATKE